jgi:hypothetical protein
MNQWLPIAIGIQLLYIGVNLLIAHHQAYLFDKLQQTINHQQWAEIYGLLSTMATIPFYWYRWNAVWCWCAVIVMHFPVFSVSLNLFRGKAWDYRNTSDPNGSKWDKWLGKWYIEALFGSVAVWVFIQFLIFWK